MTVLYLVRHAKPAATWGEAVDPGLDSLGREQALQAANTLRKIGPLPIYTSPLQRCRETATPLSSLWQTESKVLAAVAEIPSPPLSMADKQQWLHRGMQGTWNELQASAPPSSPDFFNWRERLLQVLGNIEQDSVIFTHYVAINVAVGAAQGHDRVISFRPGHASITSVQVGDGKLVIRELGAEVADSGMLLGK